MRRRHLYHAVVTAATAAMLATNVTGVAFADEFSIMQEAELSQEESEEVVGASNDADGMQDINTAADMDAGIEQQEMAQEENNVAEEEFSNICDSEEHDEAELDHVDEIDIMDMEIADADGSEMTELVVNSGMEDNALESSESENNGISKSMIINGNGGYFSNGSDTIALTADDWKVVKGSVHNGAFTDEGTEAADFVPTEAGVQNLDIEENLDGYKLRYVFMNASYETEEGQSLKLTSKDGNVLLDTEGTSYIDEWERVLNEMPIVEAVGEDKKTDDYGYYLSWSAVYSKEGEGSFETPTKDGKLFAGWFEDNACEYLWDGEPVEIIYAGWVDADDTEAEALVGSFNVDEDGNFLSSVANGEDTLIPDVLGGSKEEENDEEDGSALMEIQNTDETQTGNGTVPYVVKHMLMDTDGTSYTLKDTEHLTGQAGAKVSPTVKQYAGFDSPSIQTATLAEDGSTVIEYHYARKMFNFTLKQAEGADLSGSTPSGTRYYGEELNLKCVASNGYEFVQWSNGDTSPMTTFVMPAEDVEINPVVRIGAFRITYDLDGGTASNPDSYSSQTESFTLSIPQKEGYTFAGWTGANGTTPQVNVTINKGTSGDLAFKANWTESGVVTPTPAQDEIKNVQTGDTMNPMIFIGVGAAALAVILFMVLRKKKED